MDPTPPPYSLSESVLTPAVRPAPPIVFVDCLDTLAGLCRLLEGCAQKDPHFFITMDTEFIHRTSYFPKLSLVQIGAPNLSHVIDRAYVIDFTALKKEELTPLMDVLRSPLITKVFHSADQDCEALYHALGHFPFPLFDTQIAASFLGMGGCIGYEPLVYRCLGIHVDKSCQKSKWLRRPLSERQITYAAYDVIHLVEVYNILLHRLNTLGRTGWVASESLQLLDRTIYEVDATTLWQKFPFVPKQWRAAFILKHLLAWREAKAVQFDRPRSSLVRSSVLFDLSFDPKLFEVPVKDLLLQPKYVRPSTSFPLKVWEQYNLFEVLDRLLKQIQKKLTLLTSEQIETFREQIRQSRRMAHGQAPSWSSGRKQIVKICRCCSEQNGIALSRFFTKNDVDTLFEDGLKTGSPWITSSRLSKGWRKRLLMPYREELESVFRKIQKTAPKHA